MASSLVLERQEAAKQELARRIEEISQPEFIRCHIYESLPEYRGKGLGARLTSAVVNTLIKEGIQTIGLNVSPENPATKLYHRLGFREASSYIEGTALRE